jgi:uncharacterized protein
LGAVVIVGAVVFGAPGAAQADESCDAPVFDETGRLAPIRLAVDDAARALADTGAEVRVRVLGSLAGGDIDRWEIDTELRCPSWGRAGGTGRAPNLLVVAVSMDDHKTGIWYGSDWSDTLDPTWSSIQSEAMNPRFKEGDLAGGLVDGLGRLTAAVTAPRPPAPVGQAEPGAVYAYPQESPGYDGGGDTFEGGFLIVLVLGILGVVLGVSGRGGIWRNDSWWWRNQHTPSTFGDSSSSSSSSGGGFSGGGGGAHSGGGGGSTSW